MFVIIFHFSYIHRNTPQRPCIFIFCLQLLVEIYAARSSHIRTGLRIESFSAEGGFVSVQATDGRSEFFLSGQEAFALKQGVFVSTSYESFNKTGREAEER